MTRRHIQKDRGKKGKAEAHKRMTGKEDRKARRFKGQDNCTKKE